jgi:hypothetical protein
MSSDSSSSKRQELEEVFSGRKGGPGAILGSLLSTYLPTKTVPISIDGDDGPANIVGAVGNVKIERVRR